MSMFNDADNLRVRWSIVINFPDMGTFWADQGELLLLLYVGARSPSNHSFKTILSYIGWLQPRSFQLYLHFD